MVKCNKCNVYINSSTKICPLCKNELRVTKDDKFYDIFPFLPAYDKHVAAWYKVLIFILFGNALVCGLINYLTTNGHEHRFTWSFFVILADICIGATIYFGLKKKRSLSGLLLTEFVLLCVCSLAWDYFTKLNDGWSYNYLIPLTCSFFMLLNLILRFIFRSQYHKYDKNIIFSAVIGIICTGLFNYGIIKAIFAGIISTILEAFSPFSTDNITVPIGNLVLISFLI